MSRRYAFEGIKVADFAWVIRSSLSKTSLSAARLLVARLADLLDTVLGLVLDLLTRRLCVLFDLLRRVARRLFHVLDTFVGSVADLAFDVDEAVQRFVSLDGFEFERVGDAGLQRDFAGRVRHAEHAPRGVAGDAGRGRPAAPGPQRLGPVAGVLAPDRGALTG